MDLYDIICVRTNVYYVLKERDGSHGADVYAITVTIRNGSGNGKRSVPSRDFLPSFPQCHVVSYALRATD